MKNDLSVKNGIIIPESELEILTSRSGGPGGQHVNKTNTRITVRWNLKNTNALNNIQKNRVLENLQNQLTIDGDLIIHSNTTRSQIQNKEIALANLVQKIRMALFVPKKRIATRTTKASKEARLQRKSRKSLIKKTRNKKVNFNSDF